MSKMKKGEKWKIDKNELRLWRREGKRCDDKHM